MQTRRQVHGAATDVVNVVTLPGRDAPFVNNYGVWEDEFTELGLAHTLEHTWPDAVCYFGEGSEVAFLPPLLRACNLFDSDVTCAALLPWMRHTAGVGPSTPDTQTNVGSKHRNAPNGFRLWADFGVVHAVRAAACGPQLWAGVQAAAATTPACTVRLSRSAVSGRRGRVGQRRA